MSAYRRDFDETKYMTLLIVDDEFLEKYNDIQGKVSNNIKKGFDSEPLSHENYLKTKIKCYEGKTNKIFTVIKYQKKVLNVFVYQQY